MGTTRILVQYVRLLRNPLEQILTDIKHDNKVVFVALGCLQKWLALSVKFKCGRGRADRH